MKHVTCFLLALVIPILALAQPPDSLWSRTFGGGNWEECWSVQQTTDGGYILAGYTQSYGAGDKDFWLVKTDTGGTEEWNNSFGGSSADFCYSVQQTTDGGYILGGYTQSFGAGSGDFWLVKTDMNGDSLWSRTFGGSSLDECKSVKQTGDGGYILGGFTSSFGAGEEDFWIVKTDANGDSLWSRTFGGVSSEECYSIQQTTDGGYVAVGFTTTFGAGADIWLMKMNANGDSLWSRTYGGSGTEFGYAIEQTSDGGFILGGYTDSFGAGNYDFWLVKTDANGDSVWSRSYGGAGDDRCQTLQQTTDGDYILGGYANSYGVGASDFWMVKASSNGDSLWALTLGGYSWDLGLSLQQTVDHGYIFGGYTQSFGAGARDFWVVKTGPDPSYYHLSGSLSGTLGPGTFHIVGDISISSNDTLTLMPGTVFTFDSLYEFQIDGALLAEGTESDSIVFTTDTVANPARWRGLRMDNRNGPNSQFAYCLIENGIATSGMPYNYGGGVYCSETSPTFSHCVIQNNRAQFGGGMYCYSSSASLASCTIHGNTSLGYGGGIACIQNSTMILTDCTIENNSTNDRGGGFFCYYSSPQLTNCTIRDNTAGYRGGGLCGSVQGSPICTSCLLENNLANYGGGVSFQDDSSPTFDSCMLNGNSSQFDGGGAYFITSTASFTNCTIHGDTADGSGGGVALNNSDVAFNDCTIRGNFVTNYNGGGLNCISSSPILTNCTIDSNYCANDGGGVYFYTSTAGFTNCTIRGNHANRDGGGGNCDNAAPTFDHCTFTQNFSGRDGGGLNCYTNSSPFFTYCTISDNIATERGGGVNCWETTANFVRCAIIDNFTYDDAGGVFTERGSPSFTNCTISNNTANDLGDAVLCQFATPIFNSTAITFSDDYGIWFWSAAECQMNYCDIFADGGADIGFANNNPSNGPPGIGELVTTNANGDSSDTYFNIMLDPMFVDTAASDYHLLASSPCIDAGDPTLLPDSDGTVVEIGAFCFPQTPPSYTLSPDSLDFGEVLYRTGSTLSFWIHNPGEDVLNAAGIRVTDTLIFHANPTSAQVPPNDSVEIALTFTPRRNITYLDSVQIAFAALDEVETVIVQGTGIYDCHVLDGAVSGTLSLDCNPYYVTGPITLADDDTLIIEAGVDVIFDSYSQFIVHGLLLAIGTEQDSIKFTCDTLYTPNHWGGIRFLESDSCRLEYCVIERGRAIGEYPDNGGGGMYFEESSPVFSHCEIRDNWSEENGGGILCRAGSSPAFRDCFIGNNSTDRYGGAVYCAGASPEFTDCIITNNSAPNGQAGGVHCSHAAPTFANCTISNNSASSHGGGIDLYGDSSTPSFTNCVISGNSSDHRGGGLHCTGSASPSLVGCTISNNTAGTGGGGFYCTSSASPSLHSCFISGNSANEGGGVYSLSTSFISTDCIFDYNRAAYGGAIFCYSSTDTFTHCTITGNWVQNDGGALYCQSASSVFNSTILAFSTGDGIYFRTSSASVFEYCDIFGNLYGNFTFYEGNSGNGPAGIGVLTTTNANGDSCDTHLNILLDPMFADTAAGNYHLVLGSPCIDAGDPTLPLDPDGSVADIGAFYYAGNPPSPFDLLSPANGDTVDTLDVTLIWSASSDPDAGDSIAFYRVYMALDSTFTTELDSQAVSATTLVWNDLEAEQVYWWRVKAFDTRGLATPSNQIWSFYARASAISDQDVQIPSVFALHPNWPNPFNPTTVIRYDVPTTSQVRLTMFNLLGQEVARLVDGKQLPGSYTISWDASAFPSGVYLCRMEASGFVQTRKMVLVK